jgi:hypothetical protein
LHRELSKAAGVEDVEPMIPEELELEWANSTSPLSGTACATRQFLLAGFSTMDEQPDQGESIVIRTLKCLEQLALLCIDGDLEVFAAENNGIPVMYAKWLFLHVILNIFESSAVMERSTTWGKCSPFVKVITSMYYL